MNADSEVSDLIQTDVSKRITSLFAEYRPATRARPPSHCLPHFITKAYKFRGGRVSEGKKERVVVQNQITRMEKMEEKTQRAELDRKVRAVLYLANFVGRQVDSCGQRVSLPCACVVSGLWSDRREGNKRTINSRNSLRQITIITRRASISSSHLFLSLSSRSLGLPSPVSAAF